MVRRMLVNKLLRDMRNVKWQFLSMIILSALGVLVFSGLDGAWRDIDISIHRYFESQKLADFWVSVPSADRDTMNSILSIEGVSNTQSRISIEAPAALPGEPTLIMHAVSGGMRINVPLIKSGEALAENDLSGCLLEEQFAKAHGLNPGDRLAVTINDNDVTFVIRGLVLSPEYVITTKDVLPDPDNFGFMYTNAKALTDMPANEICVILKQNADENAVKAAIERAVPAAFVSSRAAHKSTDMIESEVTQFRSLSGLFPLLFFAVAALIVITTMTRMVENQRTQIGLLKALGFSRRKIYLHYLSYGFFPSVTGSLAGLFIGRYTLPRFLWNLEATTYRLPPQLTAPVSASAFAVCLLSVGLSCFICYISCRKNIREAAASLLRPKPPRAGKRILLERVQVLWNRFGFNAKMIQRNLFRNKLRSVMALTGIVCCTALIITAFGMRDTFNNMVNTYYSEAIRYDIQADLNKDAGSLAAYQKRIPAGITEGAMQIPLAVEDSDGSRATLLTVLERDQKLISLNGGKASDTLPADGAVMTEKLAEIMNLNIGDTIIIKLPGDDVPVAIEIKRLAPMGIGQGLYISEDEWNNIGKWPFKPTVLYIKNPYDNCMDYLQRLDEVDDIQWISGLKDKTLTGMQGVTSIAALMIAFALGLAFIVLYNMGILNFIERTREFATLKVLGFHQREIRSLIGRESLIISAIGIILGILPGLWLNAAMMRESEPDDIVLAPFVSLGNIFIACGVTLIFSLLIQRMLFRKVRSVDMVEALKSIE